MSREHQADVRKVLGVGSVVRVIKKTRGRFPQDMEVGLPGDEGLVLSAWRSRGVGTLKMTLLRHDGQVVGSTEACVELFPDDKGPNYWRDLKVEWMNETYVPTIAVKEIKTFRRKKNIQGKDDVESDKYVQSRDGQSVLVKFLGSGEKVWVHQSKVHDHDWPDLKSGSDKCVSIRIPVWLAQKAGVI